MNERNGNVYENKGWLWKTSEPILYLIEKTSAYQLVPGMLVKTLDFLLGQPLCLALRRKRMQAQRRRSGKESSLPSW
jgi:hypothetical protein